MIERLKDSLLLIFLFLLPWQTRFIYQAGELDGRYFEYGTLSLYATEFLLWTAVVLLCIERLRTPGWLKKLLEHVNRVPWKILGVFVVGGLVFGKSFVGEYGEVAFQQFVYLLGAVSLVLLITTSRLGWKKMAGAVWVSGVVQGIFAIYQFFTQHITANKWLGIAYQSGKELGVSVIEFGDERWLRAYGSFGSPNTLGIFLAVCWVLGLLLYSKSSLKARIYISVGQLFVLSGLVVSFSRGAWIASIVGFVAYALGMIRFKNYGDLIRHATYTVVVIGLFVIQFAPLFFGRVSGTGRLEERSLNERTSQYSQAMSLFYQNPVFGVGLRQYTFALKTAHPDMHGSEVRPVHNSYMMLLVELGLAGVLLGAWLVRKLVRMINWQGMGALAAVVVIAALFDHSLWNFYPGLLLVGVVTGFTIKKVDFNAEKSTN